MVRDISNPYGHRVGIIIKYNLPKNQRNPTVESGETVRRLRRVWGGFQKSSDDRVSQTETDNYNPSGKMLDNSDLPNISKTQPNPTVDGRDMAVGAQLPSSLFSL